MKSSYRSFSIRKHNDGYNAFVGFTRIFSQDLPNVHRTKIAINLWRKYHMNYKRFWGYFRFLLINRYNYNGIYGKLIPIKTLEKIK